MHIIRSIIEWLRPDIKCERVGHNMRERHREGIYDGGTGFRAVATSIIQVRGECRRCGLVGEWTTEREYGVQSLAGDPEFMHNVRKSDKNNPVWTDYW